MYFCLAAKCNNKSQKDPICCFTKIIIGIYLLRHVYKKGLGVQNPYGISGKLLSMLYKVKVVMYSLTPPQFFLCTYLHLLLKHHRSLMRHCSDRVLTITSWYITTVQI